jgi:hypothetical protein
MPADGMSKTEIIGHFSDLVGKDIREAPQYAAETVRDRLSLLGDCKRLNLTANLSLMSHGHRL